MNHETRASTLKITLDQLMRAESVCVGCKHNEGIEPMHAVCCRQGGSCATKKKVNWNAACPLKKWDNRPQADEKSSPAASQHARQMRFIAAMNKIAIYPGQRVLTASERKQLNAR
jgi:hypothetical protein